MAGPILRLLSLFVISITVFTPAPSLAANVSIPISDTQAWAFDPPESWSQGSTTVTGASARISVTGSSVKLTGIVGPNAGNMVISFAGQSFNVSLATSTVNNTQVQTSLLDNSTFASVTSTSPTSDVADPTQPTEELNRRQSHKRWLIKHRMRELKAANLRRQSSSESAVIFEALNLDPSKTFDLVVTNTGASGKAVSIGGVDASDDPATDDASGPTFRTFGDDSSNDDGDEDGSDAQVSAQNSSEAADPTATTDNSVPTDNPATSSDDNVPTDTSETNPSSTVTDVSSDESSDFTTFTSSPTPSATSSQAETTASAAETSSQDDNDDAPDPESTDTSDLEDDSEDSTEDNAQSVTSEAALPPIVFATLTTSFSLLNPPVSTETPTTTSSSIDVAQTTSADVARTTGDSEKSSSKSSSAAVALGVSIPLIIVGTFGVIWFLRRRRAKNNSDKSHRWTTTFFKDREPSFVFDPLPQPTRASSQQSGRSQQSIGVAMSQVQRNASMRTYRSDSSNYTLDPFAGPGDYQTFNQPPLPPVPAQQPQFQMGLAEARSDIGSHVRGPSAQSNEFGFGMLGVGGYGMRGASGFGAGNRLSTSSGASSNYSRDTGTARPEWEQFNGGNARF